MFFPPFSSSKNWIILILNIFGHIRQDMLIQENKEERERAQTERMKTKRQKEIEK